MLLISAHIWEAGFSFRMVSIHHREQHLRFKTYINNSLNLAQKYARTFVLAHYLLREANSFPREKLEESFGLQGTDINVRGQISKHILESNVEGGLWFCRHIEQYILEKYNNPLRVNIYWGVINKSSTCFISPGHHWFTGGLACCKCKRHKLKGQFYFLCFITVS